jgi:hypothetical protein
MRARDPRPGASVRDSNPVLWVFKGLQHGKVSISFIWTASRACAKLSSRSSSPVHSVASFPSERDNRSAEILGDQRLMQKDIKYPDSQK